MRHDPGPLRSVPAVLLVALAACGGAVEPAAERPAPLVEAVLARTGALPIEEVLSGSVRARNQVAIRPEIGARIVEVLVRDGAAVERGQALVRLDESESRQRLHQAEADVRLAEAAAAAAAARADELASRVARSRRLAAEGLLSEQEIETLEAEHVARLASVDEATARVAQARAALAERRSALAKTVVRAPVAGSVGERRAEVGMLADPSTVLYLLGDLEQLIVEVALTETMLARVETGQPALLESRAIGEPVRAELARISPFLAAESFTAVGEIEVDNAGGRLRPGMFVTVRLLVGESRRATLVPQSAVWEDPASSTRGVFVVEEAAGLVEPVGDEVTIDERPRRVTLRAIETVAEGRGVAGVSGVDDGDWVVTLGQHLLAPGAPGGAEAGTPGVARIRAVGWPRVLALQGLQDEDLLAEFLHKQRTVAAALGAAIPASEDEVDRVLAAARAAEPPAPAGAE